VEAWSVLPSLLEVGQLLLVRGRKHDYTHSPARNGVFAQKLGDNKQKYKYNYDLQGFFCKSHQMQGKHHRNLSFKILLKFYKGELCKFCVIRNLSYLSLEKKNRKNPRHDKLRACKSLLFSSMSCLSILLNKSSPLKSEHFDVMFSSNEASSGKLFIYLFAEGVSYQ